MKTAAIPPPSAPRPRPRRDPSCPPPVTGRRSRGILGRARAADQQRETEQQAGTDDDQQVTQAPDVRVRLVAGRVRKLLEAPQLLPYGRIELVQR